MENKKTLGQAIDEIINALENLDDGGRKTAIRSVCEHLNIEFQKNEGLKVESPILVSSYNDTHNLPSSKFTDIRSFKEEKNPKSAIEMVCIVAFYLEEIAPESIKTNNIVSDDIVNYFKQAGFTLPKNPRQVLVDSKAAGYLDRVSEGRYRLNPVGYNLVAHVLPRESNSNISKRRSNKSNTKKSKK